MASGGDPSYRVGRVVGRLPEQLVLGGHRAGLRLIHRESTRSSTACANKCPRARDCVPVNLSRQRQQIATGGSRLHNQPERAGYVAVEIPAEGEGAALRLSRPKARFFRRETEFADAQRSIAIFDERRGESENLSARAVGERGGPVSINVRGMV